MLKLVLELQVGVSRRQACKNTKSVIQLVSGKRHPDFGLGLCHLDSAFLSDEVFQVGYQTVPPLIWVSW